MVPKLRAIRPLHVVTDTTNTMYFSVHLQNKLFSFPLWLKSTKLHPFGQRLLSVYKRKEERLFAKGKGEHPQPRTRRAPPLSARLIVEPGRTPDQSRLLLRVAKSSVAATVPPGGGTPVPPTPKKLDFQQVNAPSPSSQGK